MNETTLMSARSESNVQRGFPTPRLLEGRDGEDHGEEVVESALEMGLEVEEGGEIVALDDFDNLQEISGQRGGRGGGKIAQCPPRR